LEYLRGQLARWSRELDAMEHAIQAAPPGMVPGEVGELLRELRRQQQVVAGRIRYFEDAPESPRLPLRSANHAAINALRTVYSRAVMIWPSD
jgi:hypothetical protein